MLSDAYKAAFKDMVDSFVLNIRRNRKYEKDKKYCMFYPCVGKAFSQNPELLVIGRACNGWKSEWSCEDSEAIQSACLQIIADAENEKECRMAWLQKNWDGNEHSDYNTRRSAFWRVTKDIVQKSTGASEQSWTSHIAWSNICKISPYDGGNPKTAEWEAQIQACSELVRDEINELKPRNVLLITDVSWAREFFECIGHSPSKVQDNKIVQDIFQYNHSRIITTIRPEHTNNHQYADEVLMAMSIPLK